MRVFVQVIEIKNSNRIFKQHLFTFLVRVFVFATDERVSRAFETKTVQEQVASGRFTLKLRKNVLTAPVRTVLEGVRNFPRYHAVSVLYVKSNR